MNIQVEQLLYKKLKTDDEKTIHTDDKHKR